METGLKRAAKEVTNKFEDQLRATSDHMEGLILKTRHPVYGMACLAAPKLSCGSENPCTADVQAVVDVDLHGFPILTREDLLVQEVDNETALFDPTIRGQDTTLQQAIDVTEQSCVDVLEGLLLRVQAVIKDGASVSDPIFPTSKLEQALVVNVDTTSEVRSSLVLARPPRA